MNVLLDEQVCRIINALDNQVRLVGGCVRDYLLNRPVKDIDMATPLSPEIVMDRLALAGIRVVPTGLKHGTVMAVIEHRSFEITTLRRDIQTDGRHAVVDWTDDYAQDAKRRDFTVNALYMDASGKVYDYVDGLSDLKKRRICFIGNPKERIEEDYLRIMRYFRFFGLLDERMPDKNVLKTIADMRAGLALVSNERKTAEFLKILQTPRVLRALKMMRRTGILSDIIEKGSIEGLRKFLRVCPNATVIERLAILTGGKTGILCLTNAQKKEMEPYLKKDKLSDSYIQNKSLLAVCGKADFCFYVNRAWAQGKFKKAQARFYLAMKQPIFPVQASDLLALGFKEGPSIGRHLKKIWQIWTTVDFSSDKDILIQKFMVQYEKEQKKKARKKEKLKKKRKKKNVKKTTKKEKQNETK